MVDEVTRELGRGDYEISVVLCGDRLISELNERYLGRIGSTNVISFPMDEMDDSAEVKILGDVVVNTARAVSDAAEAGLEPLSELAFLVIHGLCHLAGYDHEGKKAKLAPEMEKIQSKLHRKYATILTES